MPYEETVDRALNIEPSMLLVVEDDPQASRTLARLLAPRPQIHVSSAREAMAITVSRNDLVGCLIDVDLADGVGAGLGFLAYVRGSFPQIPCGLVTGRCEPEVVNAGQRFGAAVIIKPALPELMTWILERVDSLSVMSLSQAVARRAQLSHALTEREKSIVDWYLAGGDAIGYLQTAGMSRSTFKTHRQNILRKTRTNSLESLAVRLLHDAVRRQAP